jgi:hypothetical protein
MDVVYPRCCGLDIHKKTVVACLLTREAGQPPVKTTRIFGTMAVDLLALADWLHTVGCTHVAMENTGVYWRPIYNILEGRFTLLVVNAQHMKAVPGRKTDVEDAACGITSCRVNSFQETIKSDNASGSLVRFEGRKLHVSLTYLYCWNFRSLPYAKVQLRANSARTYLRVVSCRPP